MAVYHFSYKKDKKPDGRQILASGHVEYIARTGNYKDRDNQPENIISGTGRPDMLNEASLLLYASSFGDIRLTPDGIRVTAGASTTTMSIAIMIAKEIYQTDLRVEGSEKFKNLIVKSAAECDLPIKFESKKLTIACQKQKDSYEHWRKKYERNGGIIRERFIRKNSVPIAPAPPLALQRPFTVSSPSLNKLPSLEASVAKPKQLAASTPDAKNNPADYGGMESEYVARWANLSGKRKYAIKTARGIVKNVRRYREKLQAAGHVQYINRQAAFAKKGGCVYTDHRLPKWADSDPVKFFRCADRYEGIGNVRYREFEFSLPNELSLEQNIELINEFIKRELPNHYYTFAIHDKPAAFGNGKVRNVHCHLMFSERLIDDAEREKERSKKTFSLIPNAMP